MKKLLQWIAAAFAAVAFAEENEPETARQLLAEADPAARGGDDSRTSPSKPPPGRRPWATPPRIARLP